jgi:hypothetical protein
MVDMGKRSCFKPCARQIECCTQYHSRSLRIFYNNNKILINSINATNYKKSRQIHRIYDTGA